MNLIKLTSKIDSEEKARKFLQKCRWPDGVRCPRCGHEHISRLKNQHKFECAKCEYQFSVTAGTIFHGTRVSLRKWLAARVGSDLLPGPRRDGPRVSCSMT